MALNISIEGKGVIANCDGISDSAGGTWTEEGRGTISLSTDVFLVGSASISGKYASKAGFHQYDIGSGNELDFTTTTGSEADQFIYIWISMTALGTLDTLANNPLAIRLSSSSPGTSNYSDYVIAGNDDKNGWDGGFKCFIIDPTKTPTRNSGATHASIIASVRTLGIWIDCSTTSRADSIFTDQISVGTGLRVTGTSTTGWQDIVDYCIDYPNRGWGMFQEREGIAYSYGKTYIGDSVAQAANVSFTDSGKIIQYGESEYWNGTAWVSSLPVNAYSITVEDHTSYTTTFSDGILVGTDSGRSGSTIIGTTDVDVDVDLFGGNNVDSLTTLYGTVLKSVTGIISGNDIHHKFFNVSFLKCAQFDPVGASVIRNCIFAETQDTDAALLWNENIDIESCKFIANTLGAAIEHPSAVSSPYDYVSMDFDSNTDDVLNSSGSSITINLDENSNGSTSEGSAVTFLSAITLTMTVKDESGTPISGAYAYIDDDNAVPYIMNTTTNASGIATVNHTDGSVTGSTWRVRKYGYKAFKINIDISSSSINLPVTLITDPQQT